MRITVLDGFTLNPGDLSWDEFEELGELTVYDRTPTELIQERSRDADVLITNKTPVSAELIASLPSLRYIGALSTGYNIIDTEAAKSRGITVTNIPVYCTQAVAQHVFALLLELTSRTALHDDSVHSGEWTSCAYFSYVKAPITDLAGKTMGIVGFGKIGEAVAKIAAAFGMRVLAYSRTQKSLFEKCRCTDVDTLFRASDVISLHCPLTESTREFINRDRIALMKPGAFLINTARGGIINERDLADALNTGRLAGAGLDVLSTEPPSPDNPLLTAKNCVITPHIAWAPKESRARLMRTAAENLRIFLGGGSQNTV